MFHKIVHGNCGLNFDAFVNTKASITRGGCRKIVIPRAKLSCRAHFFTVRVTPDYLKLSRRLPIPVNLTSFKTLLNRTLSP
ncbi:hypothetical protein Y032_0155g3045 [Ancylostoma ceylanicum]|uniref:Uncharacterized protein n=1 Tax=Ancylostoma ceylanicum TaxID=53326 RepID=A0A016SZD7_9BILA|nr:hypothetical protein Y032_0155g3045 [Ancylostoma ceylanicum]